MDPRNETTLPSGVVTFLLTDIEDSSGWWERAPRAMRRALETHDSLIAEVVRQHGGVVVKHTGDGCWAAFTSAATAVDAAIDFQSRHQALPPIDDVHLAIRIGLHTGEVTPTGRDYFGPVANRTARVADLANGDQIICSSATAGHLTGRSLRSDGWHELRGIGTDEIFVVDADEVRTSSTPLRRPVVPSNLPARRTTFVGRDQELARGIELVRHGALVTLLGAGGMGKTRLAIEIADRSRETFGERIHYCDLVPLGESGDVAELVAEVVGARRQPGLDLVGSIIDFLRGRDVLVILDNCEHVIDAARALAGRLGVVEGVRILATSREALGLPFEQLVQLSPMPAETDGVELFVARARQRDAGFEPTGANADAIGNVVRRLDGIPLAIELAAARVRLMSPIEMADALERGVDVIDSARAGHRHDTLRATIQWSYDLLTRAEQQLFERMSVFAGSCSLDSVLAVCSDDEIPPGEIPELVLALLDKSMIVSDDIEGRTRFRVLVTLQHFGAAELAASDDAAAWRDRHASHYLSLAIDHDERFYGPNEPEVWESLDAEWSNLRAALDTFEDAGDVERGAELVLSLVWYAAMAMRFELFAWARELLAVEAIEHHRAYTDLCGAAALHSYFTVDGRVTELAEAGLAANPSDPHGFCRCALASVFLNNVHTAEASHAVTTAWLASEPASTGNRLWAHAFRVFHLCIHEPGPEAAEQAAAVQAIADETGSVTARALAAWATGQVASYGDIQRALDIWNEGRDWARSMPRPHLVDQMLLGLVLHVTARRGDLGQTLADCRAAVRDALGHHYYVGVSHLFGVTAIALSRAGDPVVGARLVGSMIANGHLPRRNARHELEQALGDRLDDALVEGGRLSTTEAGRLALEALDAALDRAGSAT